MRTVLLAVAVTLSSFAVQTVWAVSPTPGETAAARRWVAAKFEGVEPTEPSPAGCVGCDLDPFFSFTYGGKPSAELFKMWELKRDSRQLDAQRTEHTLAYTHPKTGWVLRYVGVEYRDFPAVERVILLQNTGPADTPVLARWRGQNLLRQIILSHYRPQRDGQPLVAPVTWGTWGDSLCEVHLDNVQKIIQHDLPIDYYWMDAEGYGRGPPWHKNVGHWEVRKDLFPDGFKPLRDALRPSGRQLMLWFEPERVVKGSPALPPGFWFFCEDRAVSCHPCPGSAIRAIPAAKAE